MRYQIIAASVLTSIAFGAGAQNADRRVPTEPATSPFTYEALGATPSVRPKKKSTAPADKNKTTARDSKGATSSGSNEPLAADTASNRAKPTSSKQQ